MREKPYLTLTRFDGSTVRFYRSKTDPHAFLPILDDDTVLNWNERFEDHIRK